MISREDLRQLAQFGSQSPNELAVSFYFQPEPPQDKSHREEAILAKDLVRKTLKELQLNARNRHAIEDLQKILHLAEDLHGNGARAKAVFACGARGIWREFDLPHISSTTKLFVNRRFHLKPLASVFSEHPRLWVALVDRHSARFLEIYFDQVREQAAVTSLLPRPGRRYGDAGYDAGPGEAHSQDGA